MLHLPKLSALAARSAWPEGSTDVGKNVLVMASPALLRGGRTTLAELDAELAQPKAAALLDRPALASSLGFLGFAHSHPKDLQGFFENLTWPELRRLGRPGNCKDLMPA